MSIFYMTAVVYALLQALVAAIHIASVDARTVVTQPFRYASHVHKRSLENEMDTHVDGEVAQSILQAGQTLDADHTITPPDFRALRQQAQDAEVTVVTTPQQLLDAVMGGDQHIEIRTHLDLTTSVMRSEWGLLSDMLTATEDLPQSIQTYKTFPMSGQQRVLIDYEHSEKYSMMNFSFCAGCDTRVHMFSSSYSTVLCECLNVQQADSVVQKSESVINWGNCTETPSPTDLGLLGTTLQDWKIGQCVLAIDNRLISVQQNLWLDRLYIRHRRTLRSQTNKVVWCGELVCNLWLTNVTFQGDGVNDPAAGALDVLGGSVYAEGLSIFDFASKFAALIATNGATVTLDSCTFARNGQTNGAVLYVAAGNQLEPKTVPQDTIIRLMSTTISDSSGSYDIFAESQSAQHPHFSVGVYSEEDMAVYYSNTGLGLDSTLPLEDAPASRPGIDSSSDWFLAVQEVESTSELSSTPAPTPNSPSTSDSQDAELPDADNTSDTAEADNEPTGREPDIAGETASDPEPPGSQGDNRPDNNSSAGAIIGALAAALLVCIAVIIAALCCKRHRLGPFKPKKSNDQSNEKTAEMSSSNVPKASQSDAPGGLDPLGLCVVSVPHGSRTASASKKDINTSDSSACELTKPASADPAISSLVASTASSSVENTQSSTAVHNKASSKQYPWSVPTQQQDTFDFTQTQVPMSEPPGPRASSEEKMDFLQQQLDSFGLDRPIFDDLLLLGSGGQQRRQGGQAVVQMAMSKGTRIEYAIKLFISRAAFQEEESLYSLNKDGQQSGLAQFLPQVLKVHSNDDKSLTDQHGHPLPPVIVMERGESLDLWAARRHPDRSMAFAMIHQLADRLRELHALGYVHRDLKPGNVMWLPRENRWTIIDFGCVARTGEAARLGFSMAYAAPEVIAAYRRGDQTMVAQESLDVWSLGIMAFELLTKGPAISMLQGKDMAMNRIEGVNGLTLPWEGTMTADARKQLGIFRDTILQLLLREPVHRPSMKQFCLSCERVLAGSTTVQV